MITQQQENEIQQKAQAPSPVKQHRWRVALFSILGVAMPLVAGSMYWWLWPSLFFYAQWVVYMPLLAGVLSVTTGAFLLCFAFRAKRVSLFAGVAYIVGEFLGAVVLLVGGWGQMAQEWFWLGQVMIILIILVPLLICIAIGTAIASRWMD